MSLCLLVYSSCYNAFSRVDVRVEVKIPGGVESYVVNVRGERYFLATISIDVGHTPQRDFG